MPPLLTENYHVGIICALKHELAAVEAMLDEEHEIAIPKHSKDDNSYSVGRIHKHNVVIACLPSGRYGVTSAAVVARDMLHTFSHIRYGLLVGIGAGIPGSHNENDIRLGDVVVSQPEGNYGGVVQYDTGKNLGNGVFEHKGTLHAPPTALLAALSRLQARHERVDSQIPTYLDQMLTRYPKMAARGYRFPGTDRDHLYEGGYQHESGASDCSNCDTDKVVPRSSRSTSHPEIHYGVIASGNEVVKNSVKRDTLRSEFNAICCEMEAAGLVNNFPCLVIRGICDYADSHKNDLWQKYAAATAAAYARELLLYVSAEETLQAIPVQDIATRNFSELHEAVHVQGIQQSKFHLMADLRYESQEHRACHQAFKKSRYEEEKDRNPLREPGTCQWVLQHEMFRKWLSNDKDDLLWISADPGCGKSVLSRSLIDEDLLANLSASEPKPAICYYFFKDNQDQNRLSTALCGVLHQLFSQNPQLIPCAIESWGKHGNRVQEENQELWRILHNARKSESAQQVICILDALDECEQNDRKCLMQMLLQFCNEQASQVANARSFKFLITSRPYSEIEDEFRKLVSSLPSIHLSGEDKNDQIRDEIDIVVRKRVSEIAEAEQLTDEIKNFIENKLLGMHNRTYLWLYLALDNIPRIIRSSLRLKPEIFDSIPTTVDEAYEEILGRVHVDLRQRVRKILLIIVGAPRPLTVQEMTLALDVASSKNYHRSFSDFEIDAQQLEKHLRQWCGLFIFLRHGRIYLIHQTAKEFLLCARHDERICTNRWKHCLHPIDVDREMSCIFMQYLCLHEFDNLDADLDAEISIYDLNREFGVQNLLDQGTGDRFTFFILGAENWPRFWRRIEHTAIHDRQRELSMLYDCSSRRYHRWAIVWCPEDSGPDSRDPLLYGFPRLHMAAHNGHTTFLAQLIDSGPADIVNSRDLWNDTPLNRAASSGHRDTVELLLRRGAHLTSRKKDERDAQDMRRPALTAAAGAGRIEIVELLIRLKVPVEEVDDEGRTALMAAVESGHLEVAKLLIDNGADVNKTCTCDDQDESALTIAVKNNFEEIVRLLTRSGALLSTSKSLVLRALEGAAEDGHQEIVQLLIASGLDVNGVGEDGSSGALRAAVMSGNLEIVQLLLKLGVGADPEGMSCVNALIAAAECRHINMVQFFLELGVDMNKQGIHGATALMKAAQNDAVDVVKLLIKAGAEVNLVTTSGDTALGKAAEFGAWRTLQLLIDAGADIDQPSRKDVMILASAAWGGKTAIVKFLIERGVDVVGSRAAHAPTALHEVAERLFGWPNPALVELLTSLISTIDIWSNRDGTALEVASGNPDITCAKAFVKTGANINVGGGVGHSPLYAAVSQGRVQNVEWLIQHGAAVSIHDKWGRNPLGRGRWMHKRVSEHWKDGPCINMFCKLCRLNLDALERIVALLLEHGAVDASEDFQVRPDGYDHSDDWKFGTGSEAFHMVEIYDRGRLLRILDPKGDDMLRNDEPGGAEPPAKRMKMDEPVGKFKLVKRLISESANPARPISSDVIIDGDHERDLAQMYDPATEYLWYEPMD